MNNFLLNSCKMDAIVRGKPASFDILIHVVENNFIRETTHFDCTHSSTLCLQCFDAVGWAAGRASGL